MLYHEYVNRVKFHLEKMESDPFLSSKEILFVAEQCYEYNPKVMAIQIIKERDYEEKTSIPQL
jgi:hypothetical protein